jgi:hypothetical protein
MNNDWPNRLPCPACHQRTTGQVLVAVSYITGKAHYQCFVCAHAWIVDETPSAPSTTTSARSKIAAA